MAARQSAGGRTDEELQDAINQEALLVAIKDEEVVKRKKTLFEMEMNELELEDELF